MIHIRVDEGADNSKRKFACGIGPQLPPGDKFFFDSEVHKLGAYFATHPDEKPCPGCLPDGKPQLGTPLSELSGRAGEPGFEKFCEIARSWGYE